MQNCVGFMEHRRFKHLNFAAIIIASYAWRWLIDTGYFWSVYSIEFHFEHFFLDFFFYLFYRILSKKYEYKTMQISLFLYIEKCKYLCIEIFCFHSRNCNNPYFITIKFTLTAFVKNHFNIIDNKEMKYSALKQSQTLAKIQNLVKRLQKQILKRN